MGKKIVSILVASLFLFNSVAFGMPPENPLAPVQRPELLDIAILHAELKYAVLEAAEQHVDFISAMRDHSVSIVVDRTRGGTAARQGDEVIYFRKKIAFNDGRVVFMPCSIRDVRHENISSNIRTYLCCARKIAEYRYDLEFFSQADINNYSERTSINDLLNQAGSGAEWAIALLANLAGISMPEEKESAGVKAPIASIASGGAAKKIAPAGAASIQDMRIMTRILEGDIIRMLSKAGSGHPGGSLSMMKAVVALYFGTDENGERIMRYDPSDPKWKNRDRFVLSKGHAAPGLYAALGRADFFAKRIAELKKQGKLKTEDVEEFFGTLRQLGSDLQGHTDMTKTVGVEFSGGPLGVGFSAAVGMAAAAKMDDRDYTTYCMLGDGETQEGQVDEAGRHAGAILKQKEEQDKEYRKVAAEGLKMVALLDWNGYQIDGEVTDVDVSYKGQVQLWKARGWNVVQADGEDIEDVIRATNEARASLKNGKPSIIIMKTMKGSGLPGMHKHGASPSMDDVSKSFSIIDNDLAALTGGKYRPENSKEFIRAFAADLINRLSLSPAGKMKIDEENKMRVYARRKELYDKVKSPEAQEIIRRIREGYPSGKNIATRTANGDEMTLVGADDLDLVVMAADLMDPVKFDTFEKAFGKFSASNLLGRYIPVGIREAHMAAFAAGLATCGKIPVIGTFSIFTSRMVDQLNDILNSPLPIIIVGTHGGLATGPDGRTHQDPYSLGILGHLPGVRLYEGADAGEERVLFRHIYDTVKKRGGIHYIRPARLDTPIIAKPEGWQEGARRGFYDIYDTGRPAKNDINPQSRDVVIVSSGVVTVDAIKAAKELSEEHGLSVRVVNVTQLKSIIASEENRRDFEKLLAGGKNIISAIDALDTDEEPGMLRNNINNILARRKVTPQFVRHLGIKKYGESGKPADLYRLHGLDKDGIVRTARILTGRGVSTLGEKGESTWADGAFTPEELDFLKAKGVTGQTTNLTIINNAIKKGMFDKQIKEGIAEGLSPEQIYDSVCISYIRQMANEWKRVWATVNHRDGYVSIEVNPEYANDKDKTVSEAMRLVKAIDMINVMVKIPATKEGVQAIEELTYLGINVNVTLLFGVANYVEVVKAYTRGLTRRRREGLSISGIQSVASFFVSRVNCKPGAADEQIRKAIEKEDARTDIGPEERTRNVIILQDLIGKAAIANTVLAYAALEKHLRSKEWLALGEAANVQRLLWASTEIKSNEAYADGTRFSPLMYVANLPLKNTVNTMPKDTLNETIITDDINPEPRNKMDALQAQEVAERLSGFGIKLGDITERLQQEGVDAFAKDYAASLAFIRQYIEESAQVKNAPADNIMKRVLEILTEAGVPESSDLFRYLPLVAENIQAAGMLAERPLSSLTMRDILEFTYEGMLVMEKMIDAINKSGLYSAEVIHQQGHVLVKFTDQKEPGTNFTIMVDQGFRVISWSVAGQERLRVPEDLDRDLGSGIFSMFPSVNRTKDGKIVRNGRVIDINSIPGLSIDKGTSNPIHGVARVSRYWKDVAIGMDGGGVFIRASFETTDYPGLAEAYGHSRLTKRYYLNGHDLTTDDEVENLTTEDEARRDGGYEVIADVGEHPFWIYTPGSTTLQAAVTGVFPVDDQKIPTGTPIALPDKKNFNTAQPVDATLDNSFTVKSDSRGVVTATLVDGEKGTTTFRITGMFSAEPGQEAIVHFWGGNTTSYLGIGAVEAVPVAANGPNRQGQVGGSKPLSARGEARKGSVTMSVAATEPAVEDAVPDLTTIDLAAQEINQQLQDTKVAAFIPQDFDTPEDCRRLLREYPRAEFIPYNRHDLDGLPALLSEDKYKDCKKVLVTIGLNAESVGELVKSNKAAFAGVTPVNADEKALREDSEKLYRKTILAVGLLEATLPAEGYADTSAYRTLLSLLRMTLPEGITADDYIAAIVNKDMDAAARFCFLIKGMLRPIEQANVERLRYVVDALIAA